MNSVKKHKNCTQISIFYPNVDENVNLVLLFEFYWLILTSLINTVCIFQCLPFVFTYNNIFIAHEI